MSLSTRRHSHSENKGACEPPVLRDHVQRAAFGVIPYGPNEAIPEFWAVRLAHGDFEVGLSWRHGCSVSGGSSKGQISGLAELGVCKYAPSPVSK